MAVRPPAVSLTLGETLVKPRTAGPLPDDGTRQLLRTGAWVLLVGGIAALLAATLGGGIGEHGPHTNTGWLLLILAMMCLPFGTMLTLLGTAKWLRTRGLRSRRES
jgi:hypothetical protein